MGQNWMTARIEILSTKKPVQWRLSKSIGGSPTGRPNAIAEREPEAPSRALPLTLFKVSSFVAP